MSRAPALFRLACRCGGNVVLALLWVKVAVDAYHRWANTGSLILLGLVAFNTLLVGVTIARRPSLSTSTRVRDWAAAIVTMALPIMFRPGEWQHPVGHAVGSGLQGVGLMIMVGALTSLGTSFGIVAANRGIKRSGAYRWVRHPLYAGELIFFTGFLLTNLSPYNVVPWYGIVCGLVLRAWVEEHHLGQDPEYRAYRKVVAYRFFPGLF
ncbi:MAG: isoprenylcysteine carboxyl methyltransferase [Candidatus Rokubacteria bacterium]|nr:isoprenylcysteine carboxyl methyltransferase [Candidatus Rokubacteria bacterium]